MKESTPNHLPFHSNDDLRNHAVRVYRLLGLTRISTTTRLEPTTDTLLSCATCRLHYEIITSHFTLFYSDYLLFMLILFKDLFSSIAGFLTLSEDRCPHSRIVHIRTKRLTIR